MAVLHLLTLIIVANGAPIVAQWVFGDRRFARPLDAGIRFVDGRALLGPAKTVRGVLAAVVLCGVAGTLLGPSWSTGLLIGACAMLGDVLSSFVKRRLGIAPSGMALGLDQLPESLVPALAVRAEFQLGWSEVLLTVAAFFVLELLLSRLLFKLHLRRQPY